MFADGFLQILRQAKRQAGYLLTKDTLALGYVIPAIRAHSGLTPVRQCSCRAYYIAGHTVSLIVCPASVFRPYAVVSFTYLLFRFFRNKAVEQTFIALVEGVHELCTVEASVLLDKPRLRLLVIDDAAELEEGIEL